MNRLKELRQAKKLTQQELIRILNDNLKTSISLRTLQNWEVGKTPVKILPAKVLADYFDVSIEYILGYDEFNFVKQIKVETLDNVIKSLETAHVSLLCKRREAKSFVAGFEVALMIVKTSKELLEEEED
ncbi:helix-turn-helix transcriptional regulator [Streptococcus gallolyticus]|uniref:helix-turn-helix transcriptional regulator n=1 Tax=Streptococcus gallolyticus TaxID=315405 RepID=UPI002283C81C|nr:helix-turn-helix transcriptional regulator [Streptococcus gallolyticus]MCY7193415.1 helix-turn-helix domain-containing protein [Streptococcus gallolyticus subsp. gallolyticus]